MRTTGTGGAPGDAGTGTGGKADATDARMKSDSQCSIDVDAIPESLDGGDPCMFFVPLPAIDDGWATREAIIVIADGNVVVPYDPYGDTGWAYTSSTAAEIRIAGPVCDAIRAGAVQTIWIHYYCPGIA